MKMLFFRIFILLLIQVNSVDISSFHVDYFKENTKLYYVNAMNNDKGNLYFEFWGENDNIRYFIGKNYLTEEPIKFNGSQEYFSQVTSGTQTFHESLIVNDDENSEDNIINILSMNWNTFDFINVQNSKFSSKPTKDITGFTNQRDNYQSFRNSLIKVKYNDDEILYFSFLIMYNAGCYLSFTLFKFESNDISGLSVNKKYDGLRGRINSTSCFQTDNKYIECSLVYALVEPEDFYIRIFGLKKSSGKIVFEQKGIIDKTFGKLYRAYKHTFTKIFHIKYEIGAYIICDGNDNNIPKVFLKNLKSNFDLENAINDLDFIIPNNNGKYQIDEDLFSSDAIRVSDTRFIIIFKIKNSFNMLLCIFDFNKDYKGIIVRYYVLNFAERNINIAVNIKCFVFQRIIWNNIL